MSSHSSCRLQHASETTLRTAFRKMGLAGWEGSRCAASLFFPFRGGRCCRAASKTFGTTAPKKHARKPPTMASFPPLWRVCPARAQRRGPRPAACSPPLDQVNDCFNKGVPCNRDEDITGREEAAGGAISEGRGKGGGRAGWGSSESTRCPGGPPFFYPLCYTFLGPHGRPGTRMSCHI